MKEKTAVCLAVLVIVLSVPILVTLLSVESIAFSEQFYLRQYELLDLGQATGFSSQEFKQFGQALSDYYRNRIPSPQVLIPSHNGLKPLYQDHELAHLADVHHLFRLEVAVRNLAAVLVLAGVGLILTLRKCQSWPLIARAMAAGSIVGISCFLLLLLAVRLNFNQAFTYFHLLSFDNMLWQLDPAKDNLIRLFPEQFFLNATVAIATRAVTAFAMLLAGSFLLPKARRCR